MVLALPLPVLPRAALALLVWTAVTGGLHEDGWADCLDAALAHVSPERRREILQDPRVGAHGLAGTVLLLIARFAALASVPPIAVLIAPTVGRWAMVLAPAALPAAPGPGLGARFAGEAAPVRATAAALVAFGFVLAVGPEVATRRLPAALLAGLATGGLLGRFLTQRLGGLNGDGYGAVGVLAELAALWAFLPWEGPS
jgi:adenosylcobinamide-GDP ribazoletransferase